MIHHHHRRADHHAIARFVGDLVVQLRVAFEALARIHYDRPWGR